MADGPLHKVFELSAHGVFDPQALTTFEGDLVPRVGELYVQEGKKYRVESVEWQRVGSFELTAHVFVRAAG